ncbi:MAG: hypothetical protein U0133_01505 [Gemmatimonadales bacterium]
MGCGLDQLLGDCDSAATVRGVLTMNELSAPGPLGFSGNWQGSFLAAGSNKGAVQTPDLGRST